MKMTTLLIIAIVLIFSPFVVFQFATKEKMTVTFSRLGERICESGGGDCRYIEYSKDEAFQNTDSMIFFKFNSTDVHNEIVPGITCDVTVNGWRIPFFSSYRNILKVENCSQ